MSDKKLVTISKFLSKHLRHQPEALGLTLAPGGWVEVVELLQACTNAGFPITREQLDEVVRTSDKQRFSFDETGERIRANQGHSTDVDLQLEPVEPPAILYYGTAEQNVSIILASGLAKMKRHHVHLSLDISTANKVGQRHGKPAIFVVDSGAMHAKGHLFYCSANCVWLTEEVPAEFLRLIDEK
jgi:putative RNA 2'-phosphotransferase